MKKFLAAFLAVMMMLSVVVTAIVGIAAADAKADDKVINQIELSDDKWSIGGGSEMDFSKGDEEIFAMGRKWATDEALIAAQFAYAVEGTVDLTGMTYIEFKMYVSDAELVAGKTFRVDICSKTGAWDDHALQYCDRYAFVDGWNTVRIPLNVFKDAKAEELIDQTKVCAVRVFFQEPDVKVPAYDAAEDEKGEGFTLAVYDLSFHNGLTNAGKELVPHTVALDSVEISAPGWGSGYAALSINSPNDAATSLGSVGKVWAAGSEFTKDPASFLHITYNQKDVKDDPKKAYDVTNAEYFVFDIYVGGDDATVDTFGKMSLNFELTSWGGSDEEENETQTSLDALIGGEGLQKGWNTVKLPVGDKGLVKERWNYFRVFNLGALTVGTEDFTVAVDCVRFEDADGNVIEGTEISTEPDMNGWDGNKDAPKEFGSLLLPKTEEVEAKDEDGNAIMKNETTYYTSVGGVYDAGTYGVGGVNIFYINPDNNGVDIHNMKYLEFDLYVSDPSFLTTPTGDGTLCIELSSGGICEQQEISYTFYKSSKNNSMGIQAGWNHVMIPLSLLTDKSGGEMNWMFVNWFRIFNPSSVTMAEETTVAIDNIYFGDGQLTIGTDAGDNATQKKEEHKFTVKTDAENEYKYLADQWSIENRADQNRATEKDGKNGFYYAFPIANYATTTGVTLTASIGGQLKLEVSTDGTTWQTVYEFADDHAAVVADDGTQKYPNNLETAVRTFDLTEYVVDTSGKAPALKGDTVYIHISDVYTKGGWGGLITNKTEVCLSALYTIPQFNKTDRYTFTVGSTSESAFLTEQAGALSTDKKTRTIADGESIVYKYDLTRTTYLSGATWNANLKGEYTVSVSKDGTNWVDALFNLDTSKYVYKAVSMADLDLNGTVEDLYVKVTAAGAGASISADRPTILAVSVYNGAALKTEDVTFNVMTEDEALYLEDHGSATKDDAQGKRRYADNEAYFIYAYDMDYANPINTLTWTITFENQALIEVSADKENWVTLEKVTESRLAKAEHVYTLSTGMVAAAEASGKLYFKLSDSQPADGYGPCIHQEDPIKLTVGYVEMTMSELDEIESTATATCIPFFGCNSNIDRWTTDINSKTAGSASLSRTWGESTGLDEFTIVLQTPIDVSALDTLEFDYYVSDLEWLDVVSEKNGQFELTSSGKSDKEESAIMTSNWVGNYLKKGANDGAGVQVGWNKVAIPFKTMGNGCDWTRVNFMRIYLFYPDTAEGEYVTKIDNIRFTNKQAADKEAADMAILEWKNNNPDLVKIFTALDAYKTERQITAENLATVEAAIAAAKAAYDGLSEEDQAMAKQLKYDTAITRSEGAVEDYKETLQEIADAVEDNERLIKRLQALPTEITAENYDKATADINAARAAWDELDSSTKTLLNKAGYYELLTNAEAIWEAFTPDTAPVGGDGEEGCKSVLSIGAGAMMILAGAWVAIAARKKED